MVFFQHTMNFFLHVEQTSSLFDTMIKVTSDPVVEVSLISCSAKVQSPFDFIKKKLYVNSQSDMLFNM